MKLGISAFAWTSNFTKSHLDILPSMRDLGMDGIEIPMFDPDLLPVESIRKAFDANRLDCTICAILPAGINPISVERDIRRRSVEHLKRCVQIAIDLNAKLLGGPLFAPIGYLPGHRPTYQEWLWAAEAFQALREPLTGSELTISIEPVNRSETFFVRTAQDAHRLCDLINDPHFGVTIDTFHANIEEQSFAIAIRSLGDKLRHIHASESDRGVLGLGHIPFAEIVSTLNEIDYGGYLMIEGFGYKPEERESPGYLGLIRVSHPSNLLARAIAT